MKTCPLTKAPINPAQNYSWLCLEIDCDKVKHERWGLLYGQKYRCEVERMKIESFHKRQLKAAEEYRRLNNSLGVARSINLDRFFTFCDELDRIMIQNRQKYSKEMIICPYLDHEKKFLVYRFENDKAVEITYTRNILKCLGTRFEKLNDQIDAVSYFSVPCCMAEAILVCLYIKHNLDAKYILHHDNPVYIKKSGLKKYVDAVYGLTRFDLEKLLAEHLEITEINNHQTIIYIKQELDEIIRREYK